MASNIDFLKPKEVIKQFGEDKLFGLFLDKILELGKAIEAKKYKIIDTDTV